MSERLLLKDVKKGQVFYECEYGENIKALALEDARRVKLPTRNGYECRCEIGDNGGAVTYFQHYTQTHYLKIYKSPQYLTPDMLSLLQKYQTLAPVSSTLDRLLDHLFLFDEGQRKAETTLGEIEHKGEKVMVKIKVVRGK